MFQIAVSCATTHGAARRQKLIVIAKSFDWFNPPYAGSASELLAKIL